MWSHWSSASSASLGMPAVVAAAAFFFLFRGKSTTNASSATTKIDPLFNSNKRFGFQVY
jgi:hypothetical protein